jgi:hypothetical protein
MHCPNSYIFNYHLFPPMSYHLSNHHWNLRLHHPSNKGYIAG